MAFTHGNILATFFSATKQEIQHGRRWYKDANCIAVEIANSNDIYVDTAIAVIAALSPNNKWEKNCLDADNLIKVITSGGDENQVKVSTYNKNKRKAIEIINGGDQLEILGGLKVRAFYACISGCKNSVCVDGHTYSYWIGERIPTTKTPSITPKLYAKISDDHRTACDLINSILNETFIPADIQAICWLAWRRIHNGAQS